VLKTSQPEDPGLLEQRPSEMSETVRPTDGLEHARLGDRDQRARSIADTTGLLGQS
jgi:hypothetical protein